MTQLKNKTVLVTGASSGFGKEIAAAFAKKGSRLIIAARRAQKIKETAAELKKRYGIEVLAMTLDVRKKSDVAKAIKSLPVKWRNIDILVNNAGLSRGLDKLQEGSTQDWDEMIDTNVKGLLYVTRAVLPQMVKRNTGHIINIGSIAGHEVYPKGNVYCASKHAVDAITKGIRLDVVDTDIRVTTIDPGLAETEFSIVRFRGNVNKAKAVYTGIEALKPADIADAVIYAASRPLNIVVAEMIILPNRQASGQVVHRK
ncbi:MAG TPA: SDR family NAD(P)-dependent oxidoreductase [Ignavibacteria bacterium]|nr:SDR family NAD(P)-dependent oxidoreductase [Ignavibacteria bacterium]HMQ99317.1 SDR family NAD(P)-dependent oxidoreductase [Ignavibacteria bacterium]